MDNAKILLIIAFNGYQPIEYGEPKKILSKAGFDVVTGSNAPGVAVAKDGSTSEIDITIDQINVTDYVGIFFIGGPGTLEHLDNKKSYHIIQTAVEKNIPIGAICLATRILARAGILHNKEATGYNGDNQLTALYKEHGVSYLANQGVVIDKNIITAQGPDFAKKFGEAIVTMLKS